MGDTTPFPPHVLRGSQEKHRERKKRKGKLERGERIGKAGGLHFGTHPKRGRRG